MLVTLHVVQQIFMRENDYDGGPFDVQLTVSSSILAIIIVLDLFLLKLLNGLTRRWRRASERSQLKSGNFLFEVFSLI